MTQIRLAALSTVLAGASNFFATAGFMTHSIQNAVVRMRVALTLPIFACCLVFGPLFSFAGVITPNNNAARALAGWNLQNNTGAEATDFHLEIVSVPDPNGNVEPLTVSGLISGGNLHIPTLPVPGEGTGKLTIDFAGGKVADGDSEFLGVSLKQKTNTIRISSAYWTPAGAGAGDVPIPGFLVENDPEYTIFNDFDTAIGIRGLQFLLNAPEMPIDSLLSGSMLGFVPMLADDIVLQPHSYMLLHVPGDLDPGNFLYARGTIFDANFTSETGAFVHGHQAPVPEPTSFAIFGFGALVLVAGRRRSKRAASSRYSNIGAAQGWGAAQG